MNGRSGENAGGATVLELLLLAGIASLLVFTVAPTYMRARDAARIDVAARALALCDRTCRRYPDEVAPDGGAPELDAIRRVCEKNEHGGIVWPGGADLSTFDPGDGRSSIMLSLFSGTRTVYADDYSGTAIY